MHIATYNVLAGGFDNYRDYETAEPPRLEDIGKAVAALEVETIALTDTFRWASLYNEQDLQKMFGCPYAFTAPIHDTSMGKSGKNIGITVLSNRELYKPEMVSLGQREGLRVRIESDEAEPVTLLAGYLSHDSEALRVDQAQRLVENSSRTTEGIPYRTVIVGDINSIDRRDPRSGLLRRATNLTYRATASQQATLGAIAGRYEGRALGVLLAAGFEDANPNRVATFPTHMALGRISVPPFMRLDHILHSPDLFTVTPASRSDDPVFHQASDHFGLRAEIV